METEMGRHWIRGQYESAGKFRHYATYRSLAPFYGLDFIL